MKKTCCFLFFSLFMIGPTSTFGGMVEIYVYPPTYELNWSSPAKLLDSLLDIYTDGKRERRASVRVPDGRGHYHEINRNYYSTMGHTIGRISCTLPDGNLYEAWSSLSGQNSRKGDMHLALRGLGVGVLFHDFVDGIVLSGPVNIARLNYVKHTRVVDGIRKSGNPRYLRIGIGPRQCSDLKAMITFFEGFHYPPETSMQELLERSEEKTLYFSSNLDAYDSYRNRVATGDGRVGGGCSNYAIAMLKAIGFYSQDLDEMFTRKVQVSESLVGSGCKGLFFPDNRYTREEAERCRWVSPLGLFLNLNGNRWTYEGHSNHLLAVHDPQLVWNFIGNVRACMGKDDAFGAECTDSVRNWMKGREVFLPRPMAVFQHAGKGKRKSRTIQGIHVQ